MHRIAIPNVQSVIDFAGISKIVIPAALTSCEMEKNEFLEASLHFFFSKFKCVSFPRLNSSFH